MFGLLAIELIISKSLHKLLNRYLQYIFLILREHTYVFCYRGLNILLTSFVCIEIKITLYKIFAHQHDSFSGHDYLYS